LAGKESKKESIKHAQAVLALLWLLQKSCSMGAPPPLAFTFRVLCALALDGGIPFPANTPLFVLKEFSLFQYRSSRVEQGFRTARYSVNLK
jgi:hypothetical protein